jgi:aminodeoxyfutalosine deaminase
MVVHRADWVLPIASPPVRGGWVAVEGGRVIASGPSSAPPPDAGVAAPFDGACVILPALVNAHTHLELSHLRQRVPPAASFGEWVSNLISLRRQYPDPHAFEIVEAARRAIGEARAAGTGLIGDISNTLITIPLLIESATPARVFHELLGFNLPDVAAIVTGAAGRLAAAALSGELRANLTAHAPYSASRELFAAIHQAVAGRPDAVLSVHLGESPAEIEFLHGGGGEIRATLERVGAWNPDWRPPGCGPVQYMEQVGWLSPRLLAVHGVQLTDAELALLAHANATLVTCPRSNRWVGAGDPDVQRFYDAGVRVAIGTDSLASVADLNLFAEMQAVRSLAPRLPAARILESATRTGAEALRFDADFGTIAPGKRAHLIAVRVPAGTADVEEYLLSGIPPADVRWLTEPVNPGTLNP